MTEAAAGFELDPRLQADSIALADGPLSQLRLVDDTRFAWLVLVPRVPGAVEWVHLDGAAQRLLLAEVNRASALLRATGPCLKLNVGALGNVVRQLHVHVVARNEGDAAWPGPVWGAGSMQRFAPGALQARVAQMREALQRIDPNLSIS
jgi:diadenosine tetraphosphate (Ap4A) HIT family hydrolase